jgi:hypothetical protein
MSSIESGLLPPDLGDEMISLKTSRPCSAYSGKQRVFDLRVRVRKHFVKATERNGFVLPVNRDFYPFLGMSVEVIV